MSLNGHPLDGVAVAGGVDSPPSPAPVAASLLGEDDPASIVTLKMKKRPPVEIEIDPDRLTWDDFLAINSQAAKGMAQEEQMEAINEILSRVTGQDVRKLPARVVTAIMLQLKDIAAPKKS